MITLSRVRQNQNSFLLSVKTRTFSSVNFERTIYSTLSLLVLIGMYLFCFQNAHAYVNAGFNAQVDMSTMTVKFVSIVLGGIGLYPVSNLMTGI